MCEGLSDYPSSDRWQVTGNSAIRKSPSGKCRLHLPTPKSESRAVSKPVICLASRVCTPTNPH